MRARGRGSPDDIDGVDLSASVETGEEPDRGPVFTVSFGGRFDYRMVRDGRYKYVHPAGAPDLLFDLEDDPRELVNLAPRATGEVADELERLRAPVTDTVDFDRIAARREPDRERAADFDLPISPGTGNAYLLPDGRLVDAGTPLYRPDVLAADPSGAFADWPGDESEERSGDES